MKQNLTPIEVIGDALNGNTLLREKQHEIFSIKNKDTGLLAQNIVWNKIHNQEMLLRKIRSKNPILIDTADRLHTYLLDTI